MSVGNRCAGCWAQVRVGETYQGQTVRCPRCGTLVEMARDGDTLVDEVAPRPPQPEPCPLCGTGGPEPVTWTFWGSYVGPALFHHVRCRKCGYCYNGRTGRSNLLVAMFFVCGCLVLLGCIVVLTAFVWPD